MHMRNDFGFSDLAKSQANEQANHRHQSRLGHGSDGWPKGWLWAACGLGMAVLLVVML